jgi:hypothetical protein
MRQTLLFVLAFVVGCGHASSSSGGGGGASLPSAGGKSGGIDIAALARREVNDLTPVHVAAPDGALELTVEAKGQPKLQKQNDSFFLTVPIGTTSDVLCVVGTPPDLSSASLLQRQGVEKFEEREISEVDAGELGGAAFIATRTFYITDVKGTRSVGEIKTAAAHRGVHVGAVCVHDEVGYGQTMRRVLRSIVESIKMAEAKAEPVYREIGVVKLKDKPIGVIELTVVPAENGKLWTFESSSMMLPTTPKDFQGHDEYSFEMSGQSGEVEKGMYLAVQGAGESQYEINLERAKGGYHAKGKFQGKDIDTKIASKGALPSSLRAAQLTRELVAGKRKKLELPHYSPGTDPLTLGVHQVTASGDQQMPYREQDGDLSALSDYDENGLTKRGRMNMGPLALDFTRVAQYGHWPKTR